MRYQKQTSATLYLQAAFRGHLARKQHQSLLMTRFEASHRFESIWKRAIKSLCELADGSTFWANAKTDLLDLRANSKTEIGEALVETSKLLENVTALVLDDNETFSDVLNDPSERSLQDVSTQDQPGEEDTRHGGDFTENDGYDKIQMTNEVIKWLRQSDAKFRQFFVRRMQQLAAGDRSRILAKRLKGCKAIIFETYLEQKSGHRILWTSTSSGNLLIWYVAKHKEVSRLIRLIDDAESRSNRQQTSASALPELQARNHTQDRTEREKNQILLDPFGVGNVPLKLYEVRSYEIDHLCDVEWKPRLHLTAEERDVVETEGTVLLLGRSGTGKTICIVNRIDYDRQRAVVADPVNFSQLFVARSQRLCRYVSEAVGCTSCSTFITFQKHLHSLELSLPAGKQLFLPSQKMDFFRFKREVYKSDGSDGLDALLIWTSIRSFLKGSIEALHSPGHILSKADYLSFEKIGSKRCRLSIEQRELVYKVFERYNSLTNDMNLWDDCDQITSLLHRLQEAKTSNPDIYERLGYSKVYVDEVQDYTQTEILLFFYLSGPGDLFFAGDPAQSVVEGTEFRFEDIRSVGYFVAGQDGRRDLIPNKAKTVNVNFRSHSGILNVAAAVLSCMFSVFLKEDRGLFAGPRPGVLYNIPHLQLEKAISNSFKGTVVLTHDWNVSRCKRLLDGYPLVYGIREAKGLEFHSVMLFDFFSTLPLPMQKPWRNLLLGRDTTNFPYEYPEIEGHLKLLYTAITRCIEQLFVAETASSVAGDAFVRWMTTTSISNRQDALAERCGLEGNFGLTPDQWRAIGWENAITAETVVDPKEAEAWLDKALYCFQQVRDSDALASKIRCNRLSVRFRIKLLSLDSSRQDTDGNDIEVEAANILDQLLSEKLASEALKLCRAIVSTPFLSSYSKKQLESRILPPLVQIESDC